MSACPPESIFQSIAPHVTSVSECWVTGSVSTEDAERRELTGGAPYEPASLSASEEREGVSE